MVVGGLLIYAGKSTEGFAAMFGPLAALAGVFIYRERMRLKSTQSDNQDNQEGEEEKTSPDA